MCGLPAVCGQQMSGRRRKVRGLCQVHADALFGAENPPWRRLDAKTQRDIVQDWLRGITIMAHGRGRPMKELLAEIAAVNDVGTEQVRLVTPLLPGELRDLQESNRAEYRLRGREGMVHAIITQILLGWCADASGETRADVLQRLALRLDAWLDELEQP
jgi:hypothetical protein